jgi:hypothetical protein
LAPHGALRATFSPLRGEKENIISAVEATSVANIIPSHMDRNPEFRNPIEQRCTGFDRRSRLKARRLRD